METCNDKPIPPEATFQSALKSPAEERVRSRQKVRSDKSRAHGNLTRYRNSNLGVPASFSCEHLSKLFPGIEDREKTDSQLWGEASRTDIYTSLKQLNCASKTFFGVTQEVLLRKCYSEHPFGVSGKDDGSTNHLFFPFWGLFQTIACKLLTYSKCQ